jgi:ubiquinone/menaquinone biosynthesis C-methylase UbiE
MDSVEAFRIRTVYEERDRTHKSNRNKSGRQRNLQQRSAVMERMLGGWLERPLSKCRVLDLGCGRGDVLGWFHERGVPPRNLFGVDLVPGRIKLARETYPAFTFVEGNAEQLAFPDNGFDLVLVFTLFSSILDDAMARNIARNVGRVLTRRGAVVWYDMRYPNPWDPPRRAMTKSRIRELFPLFELDLESINVLPPIANHLGRVADRIYPLLASIPLFRSHYCGLLRPRGDSANT